MGINSKILVGFCAVLVIMAGVGIIGWSGLNAYVSGVGKLDKVTELADQVELVTKEIANYRIHKDFAELDNAQQHITEDLEKAAALVENPDFSDSKDQLIAIQDSIQSYIDGLSAYREIETENKVRHEDMVKMTSDLEALAGQIRDLQEQQYNASTEALKLAEEQQNARLTLAERADALIRNTLTARREEAMFMLTALPTHADNANKAIRQMYMAGLGMKKVSKGTEGEEAVGKVFSGVNSYRKNFADFIKAIEATEDTTEIEERLGGVSENIQDLTGVIAKNEREAFEAASAEAEAANEQVNIAFNGQRLALQMVADVRGLKFAESKYLTTRQDAYKSDVETIRKAILSGALKLKRLLKEGDQVDLINSMAIAASKYKGKFESTVEAVTNQIAVEGQMQAAQNSVNELIGSFKNEQQNALSNQRTISTSLILFGSIGGIILGLALAYFIGRGISKPVVGMVEAMRRLSSDDLDVEIPGHGRKDEIGDMAESVNVFKENAIRVKELDAENKEKEKQAEREKKAMMDSLAQDFEKNVGGVIEAVTSATQQMHGSAEIMTRTATDSSEKSMAVAAAAEEASSNVSNVAAATEELSASISEISRQVSQSADIARGAASDAEQANSKVEGLKLTAEKIGEVVGMITDIAEQTNLLALNATIEAARAGDAGKGFAVVATEVKNLASQTAKATEEISTQISEIQQATNESVDSIKGIVRTISNINDVAVSISAAVEEQGVATQEIAQNVEQAAAGAQDVTMNISSVNQSTQETGAAATEALEVSGALAEQSKQLKSQVEQFLNQIRMT